MNGTGTEKKKTSRSFKTKSYYFTSHFHYFAVLTIPSILLPFIFPFSSSSSLFPAYPPSGLYCMTLYIPASALISDFKNTVSVSVIGITVSAIFFWKKMKYHCPCIFQYSPFHETLPKGGNLNKQPMSEFIISFFSYDLLLQFKTN